VHSFAVIDIIDEAEIIAVECTTVPEGYKSWSLSLLVGELKKRRIQNNNVGECSTYFKKLAKYV